MRIEYLCVRESKGEEILGRSAAIYWNESNPKDSALAELVVHMAVEEYGDDAYGGDDGDLYITVYSKAEFNEVKEWYKKVKKEAKIRLQNNI